MAKSRGRLVLVVGPSGAGKDTLLAHAATELAGDERFVFPRRLVTRHADPRSEDHGTISRQDFARLHETGDNTLSWQAHGLGYVIPKSVLEEIARGRIAVCNGSRRILPEARVRYPDCTILLVDAERPIRARRLALRGRETAAEIEARLNRDADIEVQGEPPVRIDNSGALGFSVMRMVETLRDLAQEGVTRCQD